MNQAGGPPPRNPIGTHSQPAETLREIVEQKLTAIALAAEALGEGGQVDDAVALIKQALAEVRDALDFRPR